MHAGLFVKADDRRTLERLLRYGSRAPFAQKRLSLTRSGKVRLKLRKPYYTGQTELVLEPEAFLRRLFAILPPPSWHLTRYHGIFSGHHRMRSKLAALLGEPPPPPLPRDADTEPEAALVDEDPTPSSSRLSYARLLSRVFEADIGACQRCGGSLRLVACIDDPDAIAKILTHLGLPTDAPKLAPARSPPQIAFDGWDTGSRAPHCAPNPRHRACCPHPCVRPAEAPHEFIAVALSFRLRSRVLTARSELCSRWILHQWTKIPLPTSYAPAPGPAGRPGSLREMCGQGPGCCIPGAPSELPYKSADAVLAGSARPRGAAGSCTGCCARPAWVCGSGRNRPSEQFCGMCIEWLGAKLCAWCKVAEGNRIAAAPSSCGRKWKGRGSTREGKLGIGKVQAIQIRRRPSRCSTLPCLSCSNPATI